MVSVTEKSEVTFQKITLATVQKNGESAELKKVYSAQLHRNISSRVKHKKSICAVQILFAATIFLREKVKTCSGFLLFNAKKRHLVRHFHRKKIHIAHTRAFLFHSYFQGN